METITGFETLQSKYHLTPIGPVPVTFQHMTDLMNVGHFGYSDETTMVSDPNDKTKKVPSVSRRWFIRQDKKLVPQQRMNTAGRWVQNENWMVSACNEHMKFCMIVDFISHTLAKNLPHNIVVKFETVLMIAIGKQSYFETDLGGRIEFADQVAKMRLMDWKKLKNTLAANGVAGYVRTGSAEELPF